MSLGYDNNLLPGACIVLNKLTCFSSCRRVSSLGVALRASNATLRACRIETLAASASCLTNFLIAFSVSFVSLSQLTNETAGFEQGKHLHFVSFSTAIRT